MKNTVKSILLVLAAGVLLFSSCTSRFDDINTNPNSPTPEKIEPQYMLTYVLNRSVLVVNQYQNVQTMNTDEFSQFYANSLQKDVKLAASNYRVNDQYISNFWNDYYIYIAELNALIRNNSDNPKFVNVVQMARIWKCWMFQRLTDAYGDIPYFDAANGTGINPKYDLQKDIYYDMIEVLKDAASKFDENQFNPGIQDLLYGGNNAKWVKFANTLRLRMAMRISAVDAAKAKTEAELAINAGVISSESESAYIKFGKTGSSGTNPLAFNSGGMRMSNTAKYILTDLGGQTWPSSIVATDAPAKVDPRGPLMFDISEGKEGTYEGRWTGTNPGLSNDDVGLPINAPESNAYIGKKFKVNENPFAILKYSETCFLLAEVALNTWSAGGSVEYWYEEGIKASMAEYEIASATVNLYLADQTANINGTSVDYAHTVGNNNTVLDKIHTQKWIALFPENSWEAWAEFRRTNKPVMLVPEYVDPAYFQAPGNNVSSNPKAFIQRLPYIQSEASNNKQHYNDAISRLGGAEYQIQKAVWWDPNK